MNAQLPQNENEVAVIGGGLAGLTAACYLAKAGVAVSLFEKSSGLGGRAITSNYDQYRFNRGIHALYCGGAAEQVLEELQIPYTGHQPKDLFVLCEGKLYPFPSNPVSMLTTGLLSVGDKFELMGLFSGLARLKAEELSRVSIEEWLNRAVHRHRLRRFMEATARTFVYSAALNLVSADILINKLKAQLKHPILYLDDGWQVLVDGLRLSAPLPGVRIVTGARVEAIEPEAGRVQAIRFQDGTEKRVAAVIIAAEPRAVTKLVDAEFCPELHSFINSNPPGRIACLDVALTRLPDPQHPIVQDLSEARFISAQSVYSRVAPGEGALIYTFKQLDPAHPSDPQQDERELEDLLDKVQPGWRKFVVKRVFMPRIEAMGVLPTVESGGLSGRPGSRISGLTNLYLAGDWIGPEGFLADASFASARKAANILLEEQARAVMPVAGKKSFTGALR
ncbi:MAG TPA: FAD-dependent oxidoreductase [Chloroflexia bacterium]|nr:FAD-dependent oxidoreductase [Chloroflexia bacterium]